jgi:hypothetical protein
MPFRAQILLGVQGQLEQTFRTSTTFASALRTRSDRERASGRIELRETLEFNPSGPSFSAGGFE